MQPEELPPLLQGPTTPRHVEEIYQLISRHHAEFRKAIVSTSSTGLRPTLYVRASVVELVREFAAALGNVDVQPVEDGPSAPSLTPPGGRSY